MLWGFHTQQDPNTNIVTHTLVNAGILARSPSSCSCTMLMFSVLVRCWCLHCIELLLVEPAASSILRPPWPVRFPASTRASPKFVRTTPQYWPWLWRPCQSMAECALWELRALWELQYSSSGIRMKKMRNIGLSRIHGVKTWEWMDTFTYRETQ